MYFKGIRYSRDCQMIFSMKIRDLVNFDMLFPYMQRKIYLRDLVFEIFMIEFRPFFDKFLKYVAKTTCGIRQSNYLPLLLSRIPLNVAHWNNSPIVYMSVHINLISCHPFFALTPVLCVPGEEATNVNSIFFGLIIQALKPMTYRTGGKHANHFTTDTFFLKIGQW